MVFERGGIGRFLKRGRFLWLLVSLVFVLAVAPLLDDELLGSLVMLSGLTAVFATGVFANQHRRGVVIASAVVAVLALPTLWSTLIDDSVPLKLGGVLLAILFCVVTSTLILTAVVKDLTATPDAVFGAICVYLLMGLGWALAYSAIEFTIEDSPKAMSHAVIHSNGEFIYAFSDVVYFSFVTMSTLGYGDMIPNTPLCRTLAWLQSIAGQFYLAVLVARLINMLPHSGEQRTRRMSPDPQ